MNGGGLGTAVVDSATDDRDVVSLAGTHWDANADIKGMRESTSRVRLTVKCGSENRYNEDCLSRDELRCSVDSLLPSAMVVDATPIGLRASP